MRHAVILAGGSGTRLWPLSRRSRPKQLLPLVDGKSLLELAVERLKGLFDDEHILIVTSAQYAQAIRQSLPQIPPQNVIAEPQGRDTANAVALAALVVAARDPSATMAVFTADHVIRPVECFADAVIKACDTAEQRPEALLTFGVRPTWPHTGLGYVQVSGAVGDFVHEVAAFKEKPDHQTARRYVESGHHFWNSGMFVWRVSAIEAALKKHLSDSVERLAPVGKALKEGRDYAPLLEQVYPSLQRISIDYAVMEKASSVLMVELNCEWLDVGTWPALERVLAADDADNISVAENSIVLDGFRNVLVAEGSHLLAVIGMDDCIVVHSNDATLVCNKSDSQRIKELVELVGQKYKNRYC
jgi:mannose-1-phosphate guanylyltransferase